MHRKLPRRTAVAVAWIMVWAVAAALVGQTLLLPSPIATGKALMNLARQGSFWLACCLSIARILTGYALGVLLGCGFSVLTSRSPWWRDFFAPLLAVIKATPVASFILLALVWLRTGNVPVFATVLVVLPVVWANIAEAIAATDASLLEMARAFSMPRRAVWLRVYWPSVQPALRAAIATGMGMAWKAGVAAEIICTPHNALGSVLYSTKIYLDMPALFAGTAVVIALSVALERLVLRIVYGRRKEVRHV